MFGLNRDLNPGPPAPEAGIIPLDHWAALVQFDRLAYLIIHNQTTQTLLSKLTKVLIYFIPVGISGLQTLGSHQHVDFPFKTSFSCNEQSTEHGASQTFADSLKKHSGFQFIHAYWTGAWFGFRKWIFLCNCRMTLWPSHKATVVLKLLTMVNIRAFSKESK